MVHRVRLFDSFSRLINGLSKTRSSLYEKIRGVERDMAALDENFLERVEEILIEADVGIRVAGELVGALRDKIKQRRSLEKGEALVILKERIVTLLSQDRPSITLEDAIPFVTLIVGVNGGGKTTTAGKLAFRYLKDGKRVLLSAADTFRAAAAEQLRILSERIGSEIIVQADGADPAAVVFDSIRAAKSRNYDYLIIDTAGRLHTKSNLMKELEKIVKVTAREIPGAPHEVLLVIDATTGQNGLSQAKEFLKFTGVTGTVLTKLDGTAKGGIALAIRSEMGIPIKYVGVGETMDDLVDFSPEEYAEGLLGENRSWI
ncbi:MAG: signal recognition particle-docking protein FtsY [Acidobacteriota bacterium]